MLAWSRLPRSQRLYGAFLVFIVLFSSPFLITTAASISGRAQIGGALLCSVGLILNPMSFIQPIGAATTLDLTPKVCRGLFLVGAILFFAGIVVTPLFL
jgi:hypothetical protein